MIFHPPQKDVTPPNLQINGEPIKLVNEFIYLGITIDKHLSWKPHVMHLVSKVAKINCVLAKLKFQLPTYVLRTIYNSLILCHFNYGILLWGKNLSIITKIQKKSIRLVGRARYNAHTEPIFKTLNLLKINHIRYMQELSFFYKFSNDCLPAYFKNNFITVIGDTHDHGTRHNTRLRIPRFRHEYFRKNLRYSITETINDCPEIILSKCLTHSYNGFRNYAKNFILNRYSNVCNIQNCYICNNST